MAKRYGGVPIITVPQDPGAPLSELQVHRNTENDVWDFINTELDLAIAGLGETSPPEERKQICCCCLKIKGNVICGLLLPNMAR
jgi:hypothetical protein